MPSLYLIGVSQGMLDTYFLFVHSRAIADVHAGIGGGSEQWEYLLVAECEKATKARLGQSNYNLSAETMAYFTRDINLRKRGSIGPGCTRQPLDLPFKENGQADWITLTYATIMQCFEEPFRGPFEAAERQIKLLKEKGGNRVIVTGCSSLHDGVQKRIQGLCQSAGVERDPSFIESTNREEAG